VADYGTHRILVGFDGSADSLAGLDWAMAEARLRDLAVVAYHVWQWPDSQEVDARTERALVAAGEQILDQGMERGAAQASEVKLTSALVRGEPSHRLIQASGDADLLVVGARGRGDAAGGRAGSVSVQVARHAYCPVVVTRHDADVISDGRLVVGVDGSPGADLAARFAFAEAARRHVPLHALHSWDPDSARTSQHVAEPDLDRLRDRTAQRLHHWLRAHASSYPEVRVTEDLVRGDADPALLDAATGAALLVVGSRGHGGFVSPLLGSAGDTVLHHATCPTVLVR
jgi:nucleotide-binding universal stress UspA family protein